jgi:hypothetical protein
MILNLSGKEVWTFYIWLEDKYNSYKFTNYFPIKSLIDLIWQPSACIIFNFLKFICGHLSKIVYLKFKFYNSGRLLIEKSFPFLTWVWENDKFFNLGKFNFQLKRFDF